jgi:hypothetical protein
MLHRKVLIVTVAVCFLATASAFPAPAPFPRQQVTGIGMIADLVILRPLGLAMTAVGSAFFVASLPLTMWSAKGFKKAGTYLVVEPAAYTFSRPLGQWDVP